MFVKFRSNPSSHDKLADHFHSDHFTQVNDSGLIKIGLPNHRHVAAYEHDMVVICVFLCCYSTFLFILEKCQRPVIENCISFIV